MTEAPYQRKHEDWLQAFIDYASFGEAPRRMYFWAGVAAVAGALRRKIWLDEVYYQWYPNFYIVFVAPPGVVSKSTTVNTAISLLRKVPGIKFGPSIVTWPALVQAFAESAEMFQVGDDWHTMSAMTLESGEFGNLLDPQDKQMVDLLVSLWDGQQGAFEKKTKSSGNDKIENPWINLVACTTPAWIRGNFPQYMIGGGFTARTIFVYTDTKAKYVAYPSQVVPVDIHARAEALVADLTHIATLSGKYKLTPGAYDWGRDWYERNWKENRDRMSEEAFSVYIARKQTHLHKLSLVLAASGGDRPEVTQGNLEVAHAMLTDLEQDMQFVFSKVGQDALSAHAERMIEWVHSQGKVRFTDLYQFVYKNLPRARDFEDLFVAARNAGYLVEQRDEKGIMWVLKGTSSLPKPSGRKAG